QYHEGSGAGQATTTLEQAVAAGGPFADIVNETSPEVDAIFTGHTHQLYAWNAPIPGREGTRPIVQTGNYGENVGQIVLNVDADGHVVSSSARNVARAGGKDAAVNAALDAELIRTYPRVAKVDSIVKAARAQADIVGRQPVGSVTADITTAFSGGSYVDGVYAGGTRGDRTKQSALGGLVADALLDSLDDSDRGGAEVSFVNAGGLRDELLYDANGEITLAEANAVLPFLNNLWTTTLTGDQVRQVLEQQWGDFAKRTDNANLSLGVSENLRYTYDATLPAGQRITGVWIDGVPVDPAKGYRVGSFNFLLGGGDSFSVFAKGTDTRDSGLIDRDAWIDYLKKNPGLTPDFTARGVQVSGARAAAPGTELTVTVSNLDLTSLGAPANTTLDASFGAETVSPRATARTMALAAPSARIAALAAPAATSVAVVDGSATVTVGVPADAVGTLQLRLTAQPTGTAVVVPVQVTAAGDGAGAPGAGVGQAQNGSGRGSLPTTGADTTWMGAGVLAALALLGLGLVVRRRATRRAD
ncbi:5'-nucleotidase C-terminal domain-containing protein, partial [uncultured Microbacterium sp.]|uniref:bifunctional metallophosphatase/5'-nucleotidase n=1 Tax=uncultured Microbacterium sp. TaxID=191216 RepID=UPI0025CD852B